MLVFGFVPSLQAADEQTNSVRFYDLRADGPEKLRARAAGLSKGGLAILYLGNNQEEFSSIADASGEALDSGMPVIGILGGTLADGPVNKVEIYSNLHFTAFVDTSDTETLKSRVADVLRDAYNKFIVRGYISEDPIEGEAVEVTNLRNIGLAIERNEERLKVLGRQQEALQEHLDTLESEN